MNKKLIGLIAMLSSPFLAVDLLIHGSFDKYNPTSLGGLFSFIYMTGWFLCVLILYGMHATSPKGVRTVFIIQIIFLCVAEVWNVYATIEPKASSIVFRITDVFWPISNAFMLVTGLTIVFAKKIIGWQRYIPLVVGLWLPIGVISLIVFGKSPVTTGIVCGYSVVAWSLLGLSVYTNQHNHEKSFLPLAQAA